jgi:hypothetical protein
VLGEKYCNNLQCGVSWPSIEGNREFLCPIALGIREMQPARILEIITRILTRERVKVADLIFSKTVFLRINWFLHHNLRHNDLTVVLERLS